MMMGKTPYEELLSRQTQTEPEFAEALAKNRNALYTVLPAVALPDELEVVAWRSKVTVEDDWSFTPFDPTCDTTDFHVVEMLVRADQAHSTIAALRAKLDEARAYASESSTAKLEAANRTLLDKLVAAEENRDAGVRNLLTMQGAANKLRARAETAEAEVKRLTEEKEAAEVERDALRHRLEAGDEAFIQWLRSWVKSRFGTWITHNTAKGARDDFRAARAVLNSREKAE